MRYPMSKTYTHDVLVIGATGFIGNHMLHTLLEAGKSVRVLVRSESKAKMLSELPVDIVTGSLEDRSAVENAAKGCALSTIAQGFLQTGLQTMISMMRTYKGWRTSSMPLKKQS
ncbi:hypothetical protein CRG86_004015 [Photobacterium leiognathi]|nr:hypothetical protein CRG86_004015 [Photobacterium leiognathi]